jgi:NACalpha-BTF3-like transcription factor
MLGIMTKLETAAAQDLNRGAIELAPASGGSTEFSEEDIKFTMEKHGLSREEVLRRLSAQ